MQPPSIFIVAAEFNKPLVDFMVAAASSELDEQGAKLAGVARVPGSYEVPPIVDLVLAKPEVSAVVVLGYIERGETLHGQIMGQVVHSTLMEQSLRHAKPVGTGIIGPGATAEQAEVRKDAYARAAVRAALASLAVREQLA